MVKDRLFDFNTMIMLSQLVIIYFVLSKSEHDLVIHIVYRKKKRELRYHCWNRWEVYLQWLMTQKIYWIEKSIGFHLSEDKIYYQWLKVCYCKKNKMAGSSFVYFENVWQGGKKS